ncbi:PH domain-containing protein [Rhodopirellula sallentina]|uniref:Membrane-flanked domain-containing protein n=1 Tax=Rhodopirellula sallentina SM41 TaxID=1263870 RepID=M5UAJ1_9BACT|nr:PH domain-containing protein [Rhodopirellula sallentina]EMI58314.1 membrane-flanked domain-containing protein [Rhodopirellula sallentina SM41]
MSESEQPDATSAENPRPAAESSPVTDSSAPQPNPAGESQPSPATRPMSPRDRFEQEVATRRESLDDHEPEESLWNGGYSPKAMVGWWIALIAISIGLLVGAFMIPQLSFSIALAIIVILWLLVGANYARMRLGFHYELTSQRFIHKTGLLTRRTDRIEVIDIDDVSYEQGPVQRLFGVGNINITSSDRSDPELRLVGIDKVSEVSGLIDDVRRTERRRRSLHIESI